MDGAHVFFTDANKKIQKSKRQEMVFDWKKNQIPEGINEIYVILKIPGTRTDSDHFLSSCFPFSYFSRYNISVDKKFRANHNFFIKKDKIEGHFENDMLILKCYTDEIELHKTL